MLRRIFCLLLAACLMLPIAVSAATLTATEKNANRQAIYSYLTNTLGCNLATACGILANLEAESSYNPTASCVDANGLVSYGLCQWNGPRNTQLRDYCTRYSLNYSTVGAQLQFLGYELKNDEAAAWKAMQGFPNTIDGAFDAAYAWASKFERCAKVYWTQRAERARAIFVEFGGKASSTPGASVGSALKDLLNDVANYNKGQFPDVTTQWFEPYVGTSVRKGLMNGTDAGDFNPYGNVTIAETITMACRIFSRYHGDGEQFVRYGSRWYQVYLDYAYARQIIDADLYACSNPDAAISKAQFAQILSRTLPDSVLTAINSISSGSISDVSSSSAYASAVYKLYKAGVLTGDAENGRRFYPTNTIQRSEASTILARMVVPTQRQAFSM